MTVTESEQCPAGPSAAQTQQVFRTVLDALSRPGRVGQLPPGPAARIPAALLPALALADYATGVCVLDADARWPQLLTSTTGAPAAALTDAALVTWLGEATATRPVAALAGVRTGSSATPETAALVTVAVADVTGGGPPLRLSGPGVPAPITIEPAGVPDGLVALRTAAFPAGFDLLLVDPDARALGLPRSTTVHRDDAKE